MFDAQYFDGKQVMAQAARVGFHGSDVVVAGAQGTPIRRTPITQCEFDGPMTERAAAKGRPALVRFHDGASAEVADALAFMQALRQQGGAVRRSAPLARLEASWTLLLASVVMLVGFLGVMWLWGLPAVSEAIAHRIPAEWEAKIGEQALASLSGDMLQPSELSAERQASIRKLFDELKQRDPSVAHARLEFRASGVGPNAFALPGGIVVMTDELVRLADLPTGATIPDWMEEAEQRAKRQKDAKKGNEKANEKANDKGNGQPADKPAKDGEADAQTEGQTQGQSADTSAGPKAASAQSEGDAPSGSKTTKRPVAMGPAPGDLGVAGVLAHELGHLRERHFLRNLVQGVVVSGAVGIWLGDVSSLLTTAAQMLLTLNYSREFETEADSYGIRLAGCAGLSHEALAVLFERMTAEEGEASPKKGGDASEGFGSYLSSHPATSGRIKRLRDAAAQAGKSSAQDCVFKPA